ncbi:hypothetical protein JTB14_011059 [Gonioctena quinquepunctata]|nr:hypothetical protein JTB14_011059 [Gonioctena quinquepunctata]
MDKKLRAIDLLHNAAFRSGLGNSLFVPKSQIGKISSETLQHYVASNFVSGRAAVVGLGLGQSELTQYAQALEIESGEGATTPSPYKGGELRSNKGGNIAFVAVAGEGASLKNTKEALAFAVLQRAIGVGSQIKYGASDNGIFSKAVGLFGILVGAPAKSAGKVVETAVKLLKSGSVSDEDVNRGKNQLKTSLLLEAESGSNAVRDIATQAVLTGSPQSAAQLIAAVDSISTSDVRDALKRAGQKISLASIGNISNVPYLDELNHSNKNTRGPKLEEVFPYPKADITRKRIRKRKAKRSVYTDTPELLIRENRELEKTRKKEVKNNKGVRRNLVPKKMVQLHESQKVTEDSSSESDACLDNVMSNSSDDLEDSKLYQTKKSLKLEILFW